MVMDKLYDFGEILGKHLVDSRLNGLEIGFRQLTRLSGNDATRNRSPLDDTLQPGK